MPKQLNDQMSRFLTEFRHASPTLFKIPNKIFARRTGRTQQTKRHQRNQQDAKVQQKSQVILALIQKWKFYLLLE